MVKFKFNFVFCLYGSMFVILIDYAITTKQLTGFYCAINFGA
jgi:hypothetical protein